MEGIIVSFVLGALVGWFGAQLFKGSALVLALVAGTFDNAANC